jgi:hypothetical protein
MLRKEPCGEYLALAPRIPLIVQLLELRLFMSQLNLAFFYGAVPEKQNSMGTFETVASHPKQSFIRPVSWDSAEAAA